MFSALGLAAVGMVLLLSGVIPRNYTWTDPFHILWEVIARPFFPSALVATWCLGLGRRKGWKLTRPSWKSRSPRQWAVLAGVALLIAAGDFVLFPAHTLVDHLLLGVGGAVTFLHLREPGALRHAAGYLAWTALAFFLVSFGYTAVKATLFIVREPMDDLLVAAESGLFGEPLHLKVVRAVKDKPAVVDFFDTVYFSFFDHMLLTSALLVGMRQDTRRNEFVGALVFCYVLGGVAYYLLPAVGPAFASPDDFAFLATLAPRAELIEGILLRNTRLAIERNGVVLATFGYLASMPSLHVAHELVMVYFARQSRPALILSSGFAVLTVISTLVLGWHYFLDALGGAVIAWAAVILAQRFRHQLAPSFLQRPDSPLPDASAPNK
jgi:membrane-associated phospholipid phosphatase